VVYKYNFRYSKKFIFYFVLLTLSTVYLIVAMFWNNFVNTFIFFSSFTEWKLCHYLQFLFFWYTKVPYKSLSIWFYIHLLPLYFVSFWHASKKQSRVIYVCMRLLHIVLPRAEWRDIKFLFRSTIPGLWFGSVVLEKLITQKQYSCIILLCKHFFFDNPLSSKINFANTLICQTFTKFWIFIKCIFFSFIWRKKYHTTLYSSWLYICIIHLLFFF